MQKGDLSPVQCSKDILLLSLSVFSSLVYEYIHSDHAFMFFCFTVFQALSIE